MKAQRRHDLKTNTLAEELAGIIEWIKRNATYFSVGVALVAVAIVSVTWYRHSAEAARQSGWLELANETFLKPMDRSGQEDQGARLRQLAISRGNKPLAAVAWNELGDVLVQQAMGMAAPATESAPAVQAWKEARDAYEAALRIAGETGPVSGAARLGVALASESLAALGAQPDGFDVAERQYRAVIDDKSLANSPLRELATKRQEALGSLREPIVFAPSTQPSSQPATSASGPASRAATRPGLGARPPQPRINLQRPPAGPATRPK